MGVDYYGVLQILRTADHLEIKKAYRSLALEFHPEKLKQINTKRIFTLICEAYDVLSDPLHRAVFDQYGEEGLKKGVPSSDGFIEAYHYHGDAMRTYKDFFGTTSPFANLTDYLFDPELVNLIKDNRAFVKKEEAIKHTLYLTLHEIFHGGIKKMKINRLVFTDSTRTKTEISEKILTVPFKPGIRRGTEITFPEEGDENPNQIPADIVFVVDECKHEFFQREDDNLIITRDVTLEEALLNDVVVVVNTIDHRVVRVRITDIISPGYEKIVNGEGMPILEKYPERGDLILRFNIEFPKYLNKSSKVVLRKGFELAKHGDE